jgi:hypothetical protein
MRYEGTWHTCAKRNVYKTMVGVTQITQEDLDVDEILKWILIERLENVDRIHVATQRHLAGFCENSDELSGSIKCSNF